MGSEAYTSSSTAGQVITCRAAVAWKPKQPLVIEYVQVDPPQAGEVRIKITHSSLCHTDVFYWEAEDHLSMFPRIFGHEAAGIVESIGEGVTDIREGDHVIPLFTGECGNCKYCKSDKTNLCSKLRVNPGRVVMLRDQKTRFSFKGQPIYHFLNTSSFSEYTVVDYGCVVTVNFKAPLERICLFACCIPTGLGAVWNTAKMEVGSAIGIFGLGAVGLAVALGARIAGASRIIGVDINPKKFPRAKAFGVTDFVNPNDFENPIEEVLRELSNGGLDYCFECVGNVDVMRAAFQSCHDGWGKTILVGIEASNKQLVFNPMQFFDGREIKGCTFGDFKGRTQIPDLVDTCLTKPDQLDLNAFVTHELPFSRINESFQMLKEGQSLRCVLRMDG